MSSPLQPTPLDPTAAQGGVSYSQALDALLQGQNISAPKVPPVHNFPSQPTGVSDNLPQPTAAQLAADDAALGSASKTGSEGFDLTPEQVLARNQNFIKPGVTDFYTKLPPKEEAAFRDWVKQNKVAFDPNDKTADYDMRGFFRALQAGDPNAQQAIDPNDGKMHFPDQFKTPYDLTFSRQSQYANQNAPDWNDQDQLVDANGHVLFDDRAHKYYPVPTDSAAAALAQPSTTPYSQALDALQPKPSTSYADALSQIQNNQPEHAKAENALAETHAMGQQAIQDQLTPGEIESIAATSVDPDFSLHDLGQIGEGAVSSVLGIPGDLEHMGVWGLSKIGLAKPGEQTLFPPTPDIEQSLFGPAADNRDTGYRSIGEFAGPTAVGGYISKGPEALDKIITTTLPAKAEAVADNLASKASTAAEGAKIHDEAMGKYWESQDQAVDQTTKQIGMQEVLDAPKPLNQPIMSMENQKSMIAAGIRILQSRGIRPTDLAPETVQRLVSGLVKSQADMSGVAPHEIFLALEDANNERIANGLEPLTANDFADWFVQSGTDASNMLLARKAFWQQLRQRALMGDKEAQGLMASSTSNRELQSLYQSMTSSWKMALVANLSVAMRNLGDAVIYQGLQGMARGLDVLVNNVARQFNPELPTATTWAPFSDLKQFFNPMAWNKARNEVGQLAAAFPKIYKDLGVSGAWRAGVVGPGAPAQTPGLLGYGLKALTSFHQLQEGIVRRAVFAASMDRKLATIGTSMADIIKTGEIPKGFNGMMRDAIHDALDAAWSLDLDTHGTSALRNSVAFVLRGTSNFPGLGPLFEAFPRYLYTQMQHVLDYQPTGMWKLLSKSERAAIARGDQNGISKAVVGTAALASVYAMRQGLIPGIVPGDKWDELKIGNQTVSVKSLGTIAPLMFVSDAITRLKAGNFQHGYFNVGDTLEGLVGANPLSEGGLQLDTVNRAIDQLDQARMNGDYSKLLGELGGDVAGLFNPMRQVWDFASEWEDSLRVKHTTSGQGFFGQMRELTAPSTLPEKPNPLKSGSEEMAQFHPSLHVGIGDQAVQGPDGSIRVVPGVGMDFNPTLTGGLLHQLTGLSYDEPRSDLEKEIDRLGFSHELLNPHLGVQDPRAVQLVYQNLGPLVDKYAPIVLNSPMYKNNGDAVKAGLIHDLFHGGEFIPGPGLMDAAKGLAAAQAPNEFANIKMQTSIPLDDQKGLNELLHGRLQVLYQKSKEAGENELKGQGR